MKLVIANKAYSSWSLRPWILMRHFAVPFEEEVIALYKPDTKARIAGYSGAGRVPVLVDGEATVWESLAIIEHVAERFPGLAIWPRDALARSHARSAATEMHAGFTALRSRCPMNIGRAPKAIAMDEAVQRDVDRLVALWREARSRFGAAGPFLYGAFSAADAMFAPVVNRLHAYDIAVPEDIRAYMDAVMALAAWREWEAAARAEPWHEPRYDDVA
ncbi:MAG: glutathione S-transferase family protein [Phreatobacter sp.]|nr:glutathione S-transferase family protein [Phreatobacter sp.]